FDVQPAPGTTGPDVHPYHYFDGDVFFDWPLGPDGVTAQIDVAQWDGGGFLALPNQTAIMGEAGYNIGALDLSIIARAERLFYGVNAMDKAKGTDNTRAGAGLAWWAHGHNANVKLFYTYI